MRLPNLFLAGAPKCGTTTMHYWLGRHPDIFFPDLREPAIFCSFADREWSGPGARRFEQAIARDEEHYRSLYDGAGRYQIVGDASTDYLWCPEAPRRIARQCDGARILIVLRNPVDRAYSEHMHLKRQRLEPLDFLPSLAAEDYRFSAQWQPLFYHRRRSLYHTPLTRYFETFGRAAVRVELFDDLVADPQMFMHRVHDFLEVAPIEVDYDARKNRSGVHRSRLVQRVGGGPLGRLAKRTLGPRGTTKLRAALDTIMLRKPALPDEERRAAWELFEADVVRVQALLDTDLSHWWPERAG